jgi:class 3 adenylate cyclase
MARVCQNCGHDNPEQARFCMSCGNALERLCPSCGTVAPGEARFCMSCGSPLEAGAQPAPPRPAPPPRAADLPEERRQVTVVFADLSGYTAVAEQMDPEAVKSMVDRALRRLGQEVDRYGGSVDKYIGDNVMAVFGAPVAHEDDAERAVRAALGMQEAMVGINERMGVSHGVNLALRVGVNTGEVVAGAIGDGYTVIGDTVNVAARLQTAAQPGSVTVGERTFRATSQAIEYRPLEPLSLKGKAEPVPAWEAVGLFAAQPARRAAAETPLVGRTDKLELLDSVYERVERERRPHLVTVIGQAGVGKSRLRLELARRLGQRETPPTFREGRCLPYGSGIVYWALGEVIRAEAAIIDGDTSEEAWDKLLRYIEDLMQFKGAERAEPVERRAAVISRLLGLDVAPEGATTDGEDPQRMREAFFSAVRSVIEAMTHRSPLVLVFEDIHWADHGMLDLIEYLAQWVRGPLMLLCLARDELLERRGGWGGGRLDATSIMLEPLTTEQTRTLVEALLPDGAPSDDGAVRAVAERSCSSSHSARAATRSSPRRWPGGSPRSPTAGSSSCPTASRACSQPGSTHSSRWSGALFNTPPSWDARSGRERWRPRFRTITSSGRRCSTCRRRTSSCPTRRCGLPGSANTPSSTC